MGNGQQEVKLKDSSRIRVPKFPTVFRVYFFPQFQMSWKHKAHSLKNIEIVKEFDKITALTKAEL